MYFFKNVDITNIFSSFGETEKPEKEEDKQKDGKTPCIDPKVVLCGVYYFDNFFLF
jgi:hypothetical protein